MTRPTIGRIVVAVDASPDSLAALEAAVRLAAAVDAEVVGVFVEDERLLGAARSPLTREVDYFSGELRRLHPRGLERQLQSDARRARETLRRAAERHDLPWRFVTVRGRPDVELRELAREADMITVGVRGRSFGRGPGSTVRVLAAGAGLRVLVVRRGRHLRGAVHVLHDGSEEADRAVETALSLERAGRRGLVVLSLEGHGERLREKLADAAVPVRVRELEGYAAPPAREEEGGEKVSRRRTVENVLDLELTQARAGLLVTSRATLKAIGADLDRLLAGCPCPVLVVD